SARETFFARGGAVARGRPGAAADGPAAARPRPRVKSRENRTGKGTRIMAGRSSGAASRRRSAGSRGDLDPGGDGRSGPGTVVRQRRRGPGRLGVASSEPADVTRVPLSLRLTDRQCRVLEVIQESIDRRG